MSTLLALPDEILGQIFLSLAAQDILRSRSVCFKFNSIIKSSVEIQYRIALEIAGLKDNGTSPCSPSEKFDILRRGQTAWRKFQPQFMKRVKVEHVPSGIYDLSGGIYLLGSDRMLDLDYAVLPDKESENAEWKTIPLEETYLDMGLCIDEHDLTAVITTKPLEETGMHEIALHIIQFSTGQPHPLAKQPRIAALKSEYARPGIGIEIVGDNLVLIISFGREYHAHPADRLYVFEWKTGVLKTSFRAPNRSYSGLIFLDEHLLLLPNARQGFLEVWELPRTASAPSPSAPLCIFDLPHLVPGRSFETLSCRAEPNPVGANSFKGMSGHALRRQGRPYRCDPEEAIIIFNVRILPLHAGPHPAVTLGFRHVYTFFVHRKSLLQLVREQNLSQYGQPPKVSLSSLSDLVFTPIPVPWEQWGPRITRWIEADDVATRWITTTSGQRAVLISSHARSSGSGSPIVIMDFNLWNVKKVEHALSKEQRRKEKQERRQREAKKRLDQQDSEIVQRFKECKEWVERIEKELGDIRAAASQSGPPRPRAKSTSPTLTEPIDFPALDTSSVEQVKTFLEDHSEFVQHLEASSSTHSDEHDKTADEQSAFGGEASFDTDPESDSELDAETSPHPNAAHTIWGLTTPQMVDRAGVCFSSPVVSELPCVCYSSKEHFHYDGALIDEERILGIKTNRLDQIEEFDVLYFG